MGDDLGLFGFANRDQKFWRWFESNSERLMHFEADQQRVFDDLARELGQVCDGLGFEFGPLEDGRRQFVVSAEGMRARFPDVERLVAAAPELRGWIIKAFRQPGPPLTWKYQNVSLSWDDIWFNSQPGNGKVDVLLAVRGLTPENRKAFLGAMFLLLDNCLGEYAVATRVGAIDLQPLPDDPQSAGLHPLADLPAALRAASS